MAGTVYIVIYTLYHHIYKLALEIQKGLESTGAKTKIFQGIITGCLFLVQRPSDHTQLVSETLSDEVLQKMHAPAKPNLPVITVEELTEPDGIIFGMPTR